MNAQAMMKRSISCAIALLLMVSDANAGIMQYEIDVNVTEIPTVPGDFPSNPWSFPTGVPATFSGTFNADDTVIGPISDLSLTIGGLDIASTHPFILLSVFDPSSLGLVYAAIDISELESAVVFGALGSGAPADYAIAIQNTQLPPVDPFLGSTQNWVGTFSVAPSHVVPEPTSLAIWGWLGIVGVANARRRRE